MEFWGQIGLWQFIFLFFYFLFFRAAEIDVHRIHGTETPRGIVPCSRMQMGPGEEDHRQAMVGHATEARTKTSVQGCWIKYILAYLYGSARYDREIAIQDGTRFVSFSSFVVLFLRRRLLTPFLLALFPLFRSCVEKPKD